VNAAENPVVLTAHNHQVARDDTDQLFQRESKEDNAMHRVKSLPRVHPLCDVDSQGAA
jgi:hypothetical protein